MGYTEAMRLSGFPEVIGRVRLYHYEDGMFAVADGGGWIDGIFNTREEALAAAGITE